MQTCGGIDRAAAGNRATGSLEPVTLCRFDDKLSLRPNLGPFIPCERRLGLREILEIQGRDFKDPFFEIGTMAGLINLFR